MVAETSEGALIHPKGSFLDDDFAAELDALASELRNELGCDRVFASVLIEGDSLYSLGVGKPSEESALRMHARGDTVCAYTSQQDDLLSITDAREDDRFSAAKYVSDGIVTGYLGFPMSDSSRRSYGALCATTSTPRSWSKTEAALVKSVACMASSLFLIRRLRFEMLGLQAYINETDRALMSLSNNLSGMVSVHDGDGRELFATAELRAASFSDNIEAIVGEHIEKERRDRLKDWLNGDGRPTHLGAYPGVAIAKVNGVTQKYNLQLWRSAQDTYYAFWKCPENVYVH